MIVPLSKNALFMDNLNAMVTSTQESGHWLPWKYALKIQIKIATWQEKTAFHLWTYLNWKTKSIKLGAWNVLPWTSTTFHSRKSKPLTFLWFSMVVENSFYFWVCRMFFSSMVILKQMMNLNIGKISTTKRNEWGISKLLRFLRNSFQYLFDSAMNIKN